ncbi:META domain-containing protein [Cryptosporangium sp. NPDC048952]|uniref:META domain-containing protein n=1 Tax=Cryptosporangium sp. NPDC048952 TaxID=3363961 RepID=UPI00371098D3
MRLLRIAVAAVLLFVVVGCADRSSSVTPHNSAGPISLIGSWTVAGTDDVLRIAPNRQLSLWRTCGTLTGSWAASQDLFIGDVHGGSAPCGSPVTPGWLQAANGYRSSGENLEFLDRSGELVARLISGGTPKVGPNVAASEADPPVITAKDRTELARVPRRPATLTPVESTAIVGRWAPATPAGKAFVEFTNDGTWTGSDGCNAHGGRWAATPTSMLATTGMSTLIGCDGPPVARWLSHTAIAGLDDDALVLLDATGAELTRLTRS